MGIGTTNSGILQGFNVPNQWTQACVGEFTGSAGTGNLKVQIDLSTTTRGVNLDMDAATLYQMSL